MRQRIMYVEVKSGHSDDGPAWIGWVRFSKSGRTVYYRGLTLQRSNGIRGNHVDIATGDEYWVSGPHRDRRDRLFGNAPVHVDAEASDEYRALIALDTAFRFTRTGSRVRSTVNSALTSTAAPVLGRG